MIVFSVYNRNPVAPGVGSLPRRRLLPCRPCGPLAVILTLVLAWTTPALAADWTSLATVSLSEEFNDNVNENATAKSDFITAVKPTLTLDYAAKHTTASLAYTGNLRQYALGHRQNEFLNTFDAKASLEAIENLLQVHASDSNKMVFTDAALGESSESDSTSNQVNQNTLKAGLTLKPTSWERTPVSLDAVYSKTTYWDGNGIDKTSQQIILDVLHKLTPLLEVGGDAKAYRQESETTNITRLSASGVIRYTYAEACFFFTRIGLMHSIGNGTDDSLQPVWSAGLNHAIGRTTLTLDSQAGYIDNPSNTQNSFRESLTASIIQQHDRSIFSINAGYSNYSGEGTPENKQFTVGFKEKYELTSRLSATLAGTYTTNTTSIQTLDRIYGTSELRYDLPSDYTLSLWYRCKLSNSTSNSASTYHVNMVGLGLQKTF